MSWRSTKIGIVLETTSPFDTPREMETLVAWARKVLDEKHFTAPYHRHLRRDILVIHAFQDGMRRPTMTDAVAIRTRHCLGCFRVKPWHSGIRHEEIVTGTVGARKSPRKASIRAVLRVYRTPMP